MTSAVRGLIVLAWLASGLGAQSDFRLSGLDALHADRGGRVEFEVCLEVPSGFHLMVEGDMRTPRFELAGAEEIRWEWGADPADGVKELHGAYRRILTGHLPDRDLETELSITAHYMPCTEDVCHGPQEVQGTAAVRVGPAAVDRTSTVLAAGIGVLLAAFGLFWFVRTRRR